MTIQYVDVLYIAVATAENGRDGRVATDDGKLDVIVNPPIELGGTGAGTNPEKIFAAGYSACFQSSAAATGTTRNGVIIIVRTAPRPRNLRSSSNAMPRPRSRLMRTTPAVSRMVTQMACRVFASVRSPSPCAASVAGLTAS